MKILKPMIGTAFFAGIINMFLAICALECGGLAGGTYWAMVLSSAGLSGGALLAAVAAYKYEERSSDGVYERAKRHSGRDVPHRKQPEKMR